MNGKELFEIMNLGKKPERIPFVPSIYEHTARVIGRSPSEVAKDEDLIVEGQLRSYELYKHDLVSVGIDIYNVECEALGAKVNYYNDQTIPSIKELMLENKKNFSQLEIPDPDRSGRMPIMLGATERINKEIGKETLVNGTVMGPFTLAVALRGLENFLMDLFFDTEFAIELLNFCKCVSLNYAKHFIKIGVGISINESHIAPPLLSPDLFKKNVFQIEKDMIGELKEMGLDHVGLISGGDTTEIAKYMVETGSSLLIADYNTDQKYYKELCAKKNILLRANIDPKIIERGVEEEIEDSVKKTINSCGDYNKFIIGCGVVSYNTTIENILMFKNIVEKVRKDSFL